MSCGVLLGTVHATKFNGENRYVGTDLGFNVLVRPAMYDSFHDIEIFRDGGEPDAELVEQSIVGNICESGDILAKKRMLPLIKEGDIVAARRRGLRLRDVFQLQPTPPRRRSAHHQRRHAQAHPPPRDAGRSDAVFCRRVRLEGGGNLSLERFPPPSKPPLSLPRLSTLSNPCCRHSRWPKFREGWTPCRFPMRGAGTAVASCFWP